MHLACALRANFICSWRSFPPIPTQVMFSSGVLTRHSLFSPACYVFPFGWCVDQIWVGECTLHLTLSLFLPLPLPMAWFSPHLMYFSPRFLSFSTLCVAFSQLFEKIRGGLCENHTRKRKINIKCKSWVGDYLLSPHIHIFCSFLPSPCPFSPLFHHFSLFSCLFCMFFRSYLVYFCGFSQNLGVMGRRI